MGLTNSEKIIILNQTTGAAFFTVDKSKDSVALSYGSPLPNSYGLLIDGYNNYKFPPGTNINILSLGFSVPSGFEFAQISDDTHYYQRIFFEVKYSSDSFRTDINRYNIPFQNYEVALSAYCGLASNNISDYSLFAHFDVNNMPKILMLNVPPSFNGLKFYVPVFVKVQSSYDMVAPS